jgi:Leucine-rich repeat (LRR) protein
MNVIRLLGGTTQLTELLLETSPKLEGGLELRRRNTPSARPSTGAPLGRLPVLRKLRIVGHLAGLLEAFVAPAGAAGQLTALHLEQGVIWEPDLAQLAACSGLQQLVLKGPTRLQQHGQAALLTGGMAPLTALTTLALQSCCLAAVPGDMFGLSRLRQLSLRDNVRINAIPAAISSLQQLQLLDISHTGVRRLPAHLGTWLPHMEALLLEGLAVQQLPLGLQRLTRLEARGSGIRDVDAIHRLVNLKQLALSGVDLYTPATQLTLLTALETLWLEFNSTRRWMDKQQQTKSAAAQVVVPEPMPRLRSLTLSIAASSSSSSMDNAPLCDDEFIAAAHMMVHGLPGVVGAQQLTYLSLQGCFEQGQWRALGQLGVLPRLQQLKLRGRQGILGLAAPWLQQQPQLTYLELEDCLVEAAHMQQLPAQLEALHLPTCTGSPTQPTALAQLVGVRKLRVTISSQLPLWLLSLQRLEELEIVRSAQHAVGNMPAGSWQVLQQLPLLRRVWVPHGEEEEACMPGMYQQAPHLCWYHQD